MREPSGNKQKRKKEKGKNEGMRESSGRCRKKERVWTKECTRVWWDKIQEKKKKEKEKEKVTYEGKKKKRKSIRNHNFKILPQYFHNIFTINFK